MHDVLDMNKEDATLTADFTCKIYTKLYILILLFLASCQRLVSLTAHFLWGHVFCNKDNVY